MNREELINAVAQREMLPTTTTKRIVNTVFSVLADTLASGEEIVIYKFGRLYPTQHKERAIRSPQTGEMKQLPPMTIVKFKAHPSLRDRVRPVTPKNINPHQEEEPDGENSEE